MAEENDTISQGSLSLSNSYSKTEVQMRREKKKKLAAFKTFLDNKNEHNTLEDLPARRKLSDTEMQEEKLQPGETCKICRQAQEQARLCEFCKDTVCMSHMKKRRRNPETNKWTRICEFCEDKHLMEKHYQNEMKTQESLLSQEAVIRSKHTELSEAIAGKRVKLQMLQNKQGKLLEHAKKENARLTPLQNDIDKKRKKLQAGLRQNGNLQLSLMSLQKSLPPSLQADYRVLQQQNLRITGDLVRYQKLCIDAVKARSKRERQMYEQYYDWQQQRREEMEASEQKKQQCTIY